MPMRNAARKTHEKTIEVGFRRRQIVAGFVQVLQKFALEFDQGIRYANEAFRLCQSSTETNRAQIAWRSPRLAWSG